MQELSLVVEVPKRTPFLTQTVIAFFLLFMGIGASAQTSLLPAPSAFSTNQSGGSAATFNFVSVTGPAVPTFTQAWDIDVTNASGGTNSVEIYGRNSSTITKGDLIVLTFSYRRVDAYVNYNTFNGTNNLTGSPNEANWTVQVHQAFGSHYTSFTRPFRGRGEWRTVSIPFIADETETATNEQFDFQVGTQPQEVQIGGISATDYGQKSVFGSGVVDATFNANAYTTGTPSYGTATSVTAGVPPQTSQDCFTTAEQIQVTGLPPNNQVCFQANVPTTPVAGDTMVATFWLRNANPTTTVPFAYMSAQVSQNVSPWILSYGLHTFAVDGAWRQFILPFTVQPPKSGTTYASPTELVLALNCIFQNTLQTVQIGGVNILDLGQGSNIPEANELSTDEYNYPGQLLSDTWRTTAATNIAQYRTGTFNIEVTGTGGSALSGVTVSGAMTNPLFGFGSALDATQFLPYGSSPNANYESAVLSLFNKVGFQNDLKWYEWETSGDQSLVSSTMQWFRNNGIFNIRGHNLVWPHFNLASTGVGYTPPDIGYATTANSYINYSTTQLESRIAGTGATYGGTNYPGHISNEAGSSTLKSFINDWDIVNEPYTAFTILNFFYGNPTVDLTPQIDNPITQDAPRIQLWLNEMGSVDPYPSLFINQNGVEVNAAHLYGDETTNTGYNPEDYYLYQLLHQLQQGGTGSTTIDGVGFESHFQSNEEGGTTTSDEALTPPLTLQQIFDQYGSGTAGLNLQEEVTEFDQGLWNTNNDGNSAIITPLQIMNYQALQADYLTDYLTMIFSEKNFNSFMFWGFWDGDNWPSSNGPLYNDNWSLKPSGMAWVALVKNAWWTPNENSAASNSSGATSLSGYLGRYTLTAANGSIIKKYHATLLSPTAAGTSYETTVRMELNGSAATKNVWLYEAENAALENGAIINTVYDSTADGGYYVNGPGFAYFPVPNPPTGNLQTPDIRVDLDPVSSYAQYYVWIRYKAQDANNGDNLCYYDLNDGNYTKSAALPTGSGWQWAKLEQTYLSTGVANAIGIVFDKVNGVNSTLEIDQVLVTDDASFTP